MLEELAKTKSRNSSSARLVEYQLRKKRKVKSLLNTDITVKEGINSVAELKCSLCQHSELVPDDFLVIRDGKSLEGDFLFGAPETTDFWKKPIFLVCKNSCERTVSLTVKSSSPDQPSTSVTIDVPLNVKVSKLKRRLYAEQLTRVTPAAQRIIIAGKVLHDAHLLGDYLLLAASRQNQSYHSNTSSSCNNTSFTAPFVAHLSGSLNIKHDVDVSLKLLNKQVIKFPFEIAQPLYKIHDVLYSSFHVARPDQPDQFYFVLRHHPQANTGSSVLPVVLRMGDCSKSLLDYGVTSSTRSVELEIWRRDHDLSESNLCMISQMLLPLAEAAKKEVDKKNKGKLMQQKQKGASKEIMSVSKKVSSNATPSIAAAAGPPVAQIKKKVKSNGGLFSGLKKGFLGGSSGNKSSATAKKCPVAPEKAAVRESIVNVSSSTATAASSSSSSPAVLTLKAPPKSGSLVRLVLPGTSPAAHLTIANARKDIWDKAERTSAVILYPMTPPVTPATPSRADKRPLSASVEEEMIERDSVGFDRVLGSGMKEQSSQHSAGRQSPDSVVRH